MITLYSKPNCPYCTLAKNYLDTHKFEYEVVDITENAEARKFLLEEGHRTMPQIYHNGKLLVEGGGTALSRLHPNTVRELIGDIKLDVSDFKL
jgi:glutaredoxin